MFLFAHLTYFVHLLYLGNCQGLNFMMSEKPATELVLMQLSRFQCNLVLNAIKWLLGERHKRRVWGSSELYRVSSSRHMRQRLKTQS